MDKITEEAVAYLHSEANDINVSGHLLRSGQSARDLSVAIRTVCDALEAAQEELRKARASATDFRASLARAIRDIPSRLEPLGGQRFTYVKLSEVIDTIYAAPVPQPSQPVSCVECGEPVTIVDGVQKHIPYRAQPSPAAQDATASEDADRRGAAAMLDPGLMSYARSLHEPTPKTLYSLGADRVIRKHTTENTAGVYVAELCGWDSGLLGDLLGSAPGAHPPDTFAKTAAQDARDTERYRYLCSIMEKGAVTTQLPLYRCHYLYIPERVEDHPTINAAIDAAVLAAKGGV